MAYPLIPPKNTQSTSLLPMATTIRLTPPPLPLNFKKYQITPPHPNTPYLKPHSVRRLSAPMKAYKVLIEHGGKTTELEVEPDETILSKALDSDLPVPYDCNLGVCMTCPARLMAGKVDQSDGMLSDDVVEAGYALMCVSYPRSDCHIRIIPEEELLSLQLATAND